MPTLTLQSMGGASEWDTAYWDTDYWDGTLDSFSSSAAVKGEIRAVGHPTLGAASASLHLDVVVRITPQATLSAASSSAHIDLVTRLSAAPTLGNAASDIQIHRIEFVLHAATTLGDVVCDVSIASVGRLESFASLSDAAGSLQIDTQGRLDIAGVLDAATCSDSLIGVIRSSLIATLGDTESIIKLKVRPKSFGGVGLQVTDVGSTVNLPASSPVSGALPARPL